MLNLHSLLYRGGHDDVYHAQLMPTDIQRSTLTAAKNAIRDHLRTTLAKASVANLGMPRQIEPRFRTQGSWSYRICVVPNYMPPQEVDWDLGVYLPATVWQGTQPAFAAKAYFEIVERALQDLCKKKGWRLATGSAAKDTCIRVHINTWAHIDIPLYAAPESEFHKILELAKSLAFATRKRLLGEETELAEDEAAGAQQDWPWDQLQQIVLAMRTGEWKPSDPYVVSRWYSDAVEEHGEQLRRISRYIKGWRDFLWERGGPTSLQLMICVTEGFERQYARDDVALQLAAERVSTAILEDMHVKGIDGGAENFNRLSQQEREDVSRRARDLYSTLQQSRNYGEHLKLGAIRNLQKVLGTRVPELPDLIAVETPADRVSATPSHIVAPPVVTNTRAG